MDGCLLWVEWIEWPGRSAPCTDEWPGRSAACTDEWSGRSAAGGVTDVAIVCVRHLPVHGVYAFELCVVIITAL